MARSKEGRRSCARVGNRGMLRRENAWVGAFEADAVVATVGHMEQIERQGAGHTVVGR